MVQLFEYVDMVLWLNGAMTFVSKNGDMLQ